MDSLKRQIDYLRISVTDRCNLRCQYCIPKGGIDHQPHEKILRFEEIFRLVKIFTSLGVKKVRITGGEPLLRKNLTELIGQINSLNDIEGVFLTSNGVFLEQQASLLKQVGVKGVNISLDSLRGERFKSITGSDNLSQILKGIETVRKIGFSPLKLNMVVMRGVNDDEIIDFMNFVFARKIEIRFIEFMKITPLWQKNLLIPLEEVKYICQKTYELRKLPRFTSSPAEEYECQEGKVGFIKTRENNCRICSRLRLTSTGELKTCLYQPKGISLRQLLRSQASDDQIREVIRGSIGEKSNIDYTKGQEKAIFMSSVGG
tara:strand:- start:589 stop:1539 length:951 start_codon:yes stop_codon:yes gene_type:complete